MAEKTVISIEVEGTGKAINSIKELKAELKAAQSAALNGDGKAAKRVAELKDKMDDLTDSTKSLQGSGVERIGSGFNLLSQGFKDFDFDKIKTGFKGVGAAMSAIPIFLIIEAISYLVQNFDELSKGSGFLATILRSVSDAISWLVDGFTDLIGVTSESSRAIEDQGEAMVKANEKSQEALQATTSEFDRQLAVAKAAGKSTIQIEKLKQQAIIDTNVEIAKGIEAHVRKNGEFTEDMKKQLSGSLEAIKNAKVKEYEIVKEDDKNKKEKSKERLANNLEAIKKIEDAQIAAIKNEEVRLISAEVKANERRIKEIKDGKESAELKRQELEAQAVLYEQNISKINADAAAKRKAEEDKIAADKKAEEEKKLKALEDEKKKQLALEQRDLKAKSELQLIAAGEDATKQLEAKQAALATQRDIELSNTELTESERAAIKARYAKQSADLDEQFEANKQQAILEIAKQGLQGAQNLSDLFFTAKMAKVKKGSKEEEDLARKQFNINKALQLGLATIDGFKAISASLASSPVAIGPAPNPAGIASLAFVAISTAATIAKIASSQFKGGGGAGGGGGEMPSVGSPSIPTSNGTPSIAAPTQNTTTFTGNANNNFNQPPIKTYVVETDLRNSTNTIDKIKDQATF
jgi:hypothetical protein